MKTSFRFVVSLFLSLILIASSVLPSLAAEWNGSTADPSIGGSSPKIIRLERFFVPTEERKLNE